MNGNVRIAKSLIALARELVGSYGDVAYHKGEYKNFTGTVIWKNTAGDVKDATFYLNNEGIVFVDGTWEDGHFGGNHFDQWENGTWKKGEWISGFDKDGNKHNDSPDRW